MLLIICYADANRYAVDARHVDEVLPRAALSRSPQSPPWFAGLLTHRGKTAPVLDLNGLVAGTPCSNRLSSRIILLRVEVNASWSKLGVLAERVGVKESTADLAVGSDAVAGHDPLGRLLLDEEGLLRLIEVPRLISEERRSVLFPTLESETR
jgi:chemotaxis signal transduction protein